MNSEKRRRGPHSPSFILVSSNNSLSGRPARFARGAPSLNRSYHLPGPGPGSWSIYLPRPWLSQSSGSDLTIAPGSWLSQVPGSCLAIFQDFGSLLYNIFLFIPSKPLSFTDHRLRLGFRVNHNPFTNHNLGLGFQLLSRSTPPLVGLRPKDSC
jgi:hypothetical protein